MVSGLILCGALTFVAVTATQGRREYQEIHVGRREVSNTCTNGYEKLVNSTMCATDNPAYVPGSAKVSDEDQKWIIDQHNDIRRNVTPTATNMLKVYWDDELAKVAEKWARQCVNGHDSKLHMTRYIPKYGLPPGQNAAYGHDSWNIPLIQWYGEVNLYQYGKDLDSYLGEGGWKSIAHYTQMVTSSVVLVGCGYAQCTEGSKKYYFCNYLSWQSDLVRPYENGTTCGACPTSCKDKLCDCGNNFCFNGGTLDIDKCTCTCKYPFTGERCLEKNCGNKPDPGVCPSWTASDCDQNYVRRSCPVMCEVCPVPCNGTECENGGTMDYDKCQCNCAKFWGGDTCATKNCTGIVDVPNCIYWTENCDPPNIYSPYTRAHCPFMCGICPGSEGE